MDGDEELAQLDLTSWSASIRGVTSSARPVRPQQWRRRLEADSTLSG
jgi:hypothetical protein